MKISVSKKCMLPAIAGLMLSGASAMAGFTTINPPAAGEDGLNTIFNNIYAQTFTPSGLNFIGNAGVTLTRMNDNGVGSPMNLSTGGFATANDQLWSDGVVAANAKVRFASDQQQFGFIAGTSGGVYQNLFTVSGSGYAVSGNQTQLIGPSFRWARNGSGIGGLQTSQDSDNTNNGDGPNGKDHLVTYKVTGLNNGALATWLLCWEDRNTGQPNGDFDYNDLVVEINAVPTPMAAGMGLLGLAGIAGVRRRKMS